MKILVNEEDLKFIEESIINGEVLNKTLIDGSKKNGQMYLKK